MMDIAFCAKLVQIKTAQWKMVPHLKSHTDHLA